MLVNQWAENWLEVGDITQDEADWVKRQMLSQGILLPTLKHIRKVGHTNL